MAEKRRCENCGKEMTQQFIGLKHCKCGISWKKGIGYFQRTNDMVFALERKVVKRGKDKGKVRQVPVISYNDEWDEDMDAPCIACKSDKLIADGCVPYSYSRDGKTKYTRIKVGDPGDMYENGGTDSECTDCGAKYGHPHHFRCSFEVCPICVGQKMTCRCVFYTTPN